MNKYNLPEKVEKMIKETSLHSTEIVIKRTFLSNLGTHLENLNYKQQNIESGMADLLESKEGEAFVSAMLKTALQYKNDSLAKVYETLIDELQAFIPNEQPSSQAGLRVIIYRLQAAYQKVMQGAGKDN